MRAFIYDATFRALTAKWYRQVLMLLPEGARVLDVGIGTAGALLVSADLVRDRGLYITGVDIDPDYVNKARKAINAANLADRVRALHQSIYDHDEPGYDAVYFSASFMLMPDPVAVLEHVMSLLAPGGRIFFTQTFQIKRSILAEKTKPLLKKLTTIEFGQVTYEADFMEAVSKAGMEILSVEALGKGPGISHRLVIGRPPTGVPRSDDGPSASPAP